MALPLGELARRAWEGKDAVKKKHSDKMALKKPMLIAVLLFYGDEACPLGHAAFVKEISCFILCRTTSRQPRCTSAVRIQLMG